MTALIECVSCQHGDHSGHEPGRSDAGVLGGWRCPCAGECEKRRGPTERVQAALDGIARAVAQANASGTQPPLVAPTRPMRVPDEIRLCAACGYQAWREG